MLRDLPTPFLAVDLDAVDRNIAAMQRLCDLHDLALRPHIKTHKMPSIAALQQEAGARGITCQKLGEAEVMADAGFDDILVTFPLIGTGKAERAARLATKVRLVVGADSEVAVRELSTAADAVGTSIGVLVDCDTGLARTGVQSPSDAAELAKLSSRLPGLRYCGFMTHPASVDGAAWLRLAIELTERHGLAVECVSGGGTLQARQVGGDGVFTELRVGTYVYGDRRCVAAGVTTVEDCALRVTATVVSRPTDGRAIIDAGSKSVSPEIPQELDDFGYGLVVEHPYAVLHDLSEEHGILDVSRCTPRPEIGDVVTVIPNHACGTVNLHDEVAVHRRELDVVCSPIPARGRVR